MGTPIHWNLKFLFASVTFVQGVRSSLYGQFFFLHLPPLTFRALDPHCMAKKARTDCALLIFNPFFFFIITAPPLITDRALLIFNLHLLLHHWLPLVHGSALHGRRSRHHHHLRRRGTLKKIVSGTRKRNQVPDV